MKALIAALVFVTLIAARHFAAKAKMNPALLDFASMAIIALIVALH
jgi:hypothetical protein